jgi:hypothetical protein
LVAVTPVPAFAFIADTRFVAMVVAVVDTAKLEPVLEPAEPPPKGVKVALTFLPGPFVWLSE